MDTPTISSFTSRSETGTTRRARRTTTARRNQLIRFCYRRSRRVPLLTIWCVLLAGVAAGQEMREIQRSPARRASRRGPVVEGEILYTVAQVLPDAHKSARRRISSIESCGGLFAVLGADGVEVLSDTTYRLAKTDRDTEICSSAEAFTTVGGSRVTLCPSFGWLSAKEGAVILIHEALHSAGLGERPATPDGPTPAQIDQLVMTRCRF